VPSVLACVVEQVGDQPVEVGGCRVDGDRGFRPQPEVRTARPPAGMGADHGGEVDELTLEGRVVREPREQKEVGSDRLEPVDVTDRRVEEPAQVGLVGMQPRFLELGLEPGERAEELVGGVGGEPAKPGRRREGGGRAV
jgi:hypothetical protein